MKPPQITLFILLFCLTAFNLNAQTDSTKLLVGQWIFVRAVDSNGNEVKHVPQDYKAPDGSDIQIVASGPDITINADHTYVKKFTEVNSDKGNWKLIPGNQVEYEMVIPKKSRQGDMIKQTEALLGKKWRTDSKGNYLDASSDKLLSLTETEMKVEYHKVYVLIYKKQQ